MRESVLERWVDDLERELAVARQTIRSLQDALAAEHKDDEALLAREQELTNALQRIESAAVTCVERLAAGHKPPTSGTELDPQRILDLVRAALARVETSSTRQSSEHDSDCSCLVCDPDDSPADEHLCTPENPCRGCLDRGFAPAVEEQDDGMGYNCSGGSSHLPACGGTC